MQNLLIQQGHRCNTVFLYPSGFPHGARNLVTGRRMSGSGMPPSRIPCEACHAPGVSARILVKITVAARSHRLSGAAGTSRVTVFDLDVDDEQWTNPSARLMVTGTAGLA
ncbi:hypothetical protein O9929_20155 [Vibrio lentus]|nr:hypothetical protein [Vibrio lentus]